MGVHASACLEGLGVITCWIPAPRSGVHSGATHLGETDCALWSSTLKSFRSRNGLKLRGCAGILQPLSPEDPEAGHMALA